MWMGGLVVYPWVGGGGGGFKLLPEVGWGGDTQAVCQLPGTVCHVCFLIPWVCDVSRKGGGGLRGTHQPLSVLCSSLCGEHVQLLRMKRDRNKGFYSEKR